MQDKIYQANIPLLKDNKANSNLSRSNHQLQYNNFFSELSKLTIYGIQETPQYIKQILHFEGIQYNPLIYYPFSFIILNNSQNFEAIEAQIKWGNFTTIIKILCFAGESIFHSCKSTNGSMSKVFHIDQQYGLFTVKCNQIKMQPAIQKIDFIQRALKEFFIFKIASSLSLGPYIKRYCGFDLIISMNCIQFAMQNCRKLKIMNQAATLRLKESLYILHKMKMVHFDIKPDNLMWSPHFKREVFIDFGLSEIFEEGHGFKYPIKFKGSLNYCSQEMAKLFHYDDKLSIDVYYNDSVALGKSISDLKSSLIESIYMNQFSITQKHVSNYDDEDVANIMNAQNYNQQFHRSLKIILLKYYLYTNDALKIDEHFVSDKCLFFSQQITTFVKNTYKTQAFKAYYHKYLKSSVKDSVEYGWIEGWQKSLYSKKDNNSQCENELSIYYFIYKQLKNICQNRSPSLDYLSKGEIQTILFVSKIQDLQVYFFSFINYVSFLNNIHQIKVQQKLVAAALFTKIIFPYSGDKLIQQFHRAIFIKDSIISFTLFYFITSITMLISFYQGKMIHKSLNHILK